MRPSSLLTIGLCLLVAIIAVMGRVVAPSGLYQNTDECKTMAFTTDMLVNGRWLVPVDLAGAPALKPPLVNWLASPSVALLGPTELAHKVPLIASALATACTVAWGATWLLGRLGRGHSDGDQPGAPSRAAPGADRGLPADDVDRAIAAHALPLGIATGAAWLAAPESIKQLYFCRPDGVQNAFLAAAFFLVSHATITASPGPHPGASTGRRAVVAIGWVCAGLAALAKGPMALLVPAFAILLALTRPDRLRALAHSGLWWGLPLMVAIPMAWLVPAWIVEPEHVRTTLLGGEVAGRFSTEGEGARLSQIPMNLLRVPGFYVERFPPWAAFAAVGLVLVARRGWFAHALGPAVLWVALLTAVLVVMAGESGSFNAPAYPALAVLSTYALARMVARGRAARVARLAPVVAALALVVAGAVVAREAFLSRAARTGLGDEITAFARAARPVVGTDAIAFLNPDPHNPVQLLMGRHQGGPVEPHSAADAAWVVGPPGLSVPGVRLEPVLQSEALRRTKAGGRGERAEVPGLVLYSVVRGPAPATP